MKAAAPVVLAFEVSHSYWLALFCFVERKFNDASCARRFGAVRVIHRDQIGVRMSLVCSGAGCVTLPAAWQNVARHDFVHDRQGLRVKNLVCLRPQLKLRLDLAVDAIFIFSLLRHPSTAAPSSLTLNLNIKE